MKIACTLAQRPYKLQTVPRWMLKLIALFVPTLRENMEMMYQFDFDYRFDISKSEMALRVSATLYHEGVAARLTTPA